MCRIFCLERGTIRLCKGMLCNKGRNMTPYELAGVAFGLLSVWLTVKASIWCWPTGIISVAAFGLLFLEIKLYVDTLGERLLWCRAQTVPEYTITTAP